MPVELVEQPRNVVAGAPADTVIKEIPALEHVQGNLVTVQVPYGNETSTIRIRVLRYCVGLGIDLGCGGEKIVPQAIGIDMQQGAANLRLDFGDLRIFADNVFNYCYSSHAIEDIYYKEPVLREWWRVLKPNGHMVLAWPDWTKYPDDDRECNLDHKQKFSSRDIKRMMARFHGEIVLEDQVARSEILVVRKLSSNPKGQLKKKIIQRPEKSAVVVRYGAFGDAVMVTPVLKRLKQDGYHVTLNCSDYCEMVFRNNPNIDELIIHEKDSVKNDGKELDGYWKLLSEGADRFINLSGSVEGSMLLLEGAHPVGCDTHKQHYELGCEPCESARAIRDENLGSRNYYERTLDLAGYPASTRESLGQDQGARGELFFTHGELFRAHHLVSKWRRKNRFVVIWSMSGSSFHKAYPYWAVVAVEFCRRHPEVLVYTVGDNMSSLMEVSDHPQIIPRSGKWSIRESMCMTQFADLVIGGETGVLHAAGCYDTPKVVLLSHSTPENLTKTWKNCLSLTPDRSQSPCYPCHQLHYTKESCPLKPFPSFIHDQGYERAPVAVDPPQDKSQYWPICMTHGISISRVIEAMESWHQVKAKGVKFGDQFVSGSSGLH